MTGMPPGRPPRPPTPPGSPAPAHGDGPTRPNAPTGPTGLRDQIAEVLYRHTMDHAAGVLARHLTGRLAAHVDPDHVGAALVARQKLTRTEGDTDA